MKSPCEDENRRCILVSVSLTKVKNIFLFAVKSWKKPPTSLPNQYYKVAVENWKIETKCYNLHKNTKNLALFLFLVPTFQKFLVLLWISVM